jgi:hypothetical protein
MRNRVRRWFTRAREPRYFVFALAGVAYLGLMVFVRVGTAQLGSRPDAPLAPIDALPQFADIGWTVGGVLLLAGAAGSWLIPASGGLLQFTRAEVQFLMPSPASRRRLVVYRMLRSQLPLLFGSFISAIVIPSGSWTSRIRIGFTLWVLFFTAKVYFSAVTLTRAKLRSTSAVERLVARCTIGVIIGSLIVVGAVVGRAYSVPPALDVAELISRLSYSALPIVGQALLFPFSMLVSPLFVERWSDFFGALGGSALVLVAASAWLLSADETFERVVVEPGLQRKALERRMTSYRGSRPLWRLAPTGRFEAVFLWKAALQTFRVVDRGLVIRVSAVVVWIAIVIVSSGQGQSLAAGIGLFAATGAVMATIVGPLVVRLDFRQDLQHLELLKAWPVPAAAAIRGVMIWPAVLLTSITWAMIALAWFLSTAVFPDSSDALRAAVAGASIVLAPALIGGQLLIHNAAALAFPAWMVSGSRAGRGLDAIGQRLLLVGATMMLLVVMALPGLLAAWGLWIVLSPMIGLGAFVLGATVCALAMLTEVLLSVQALGPLYERLDLLAVERSE